jgi:trehalose 6-phosphate phosphatase
VKNTTGNVTSGGLKAEVKSRLRPFLQAVAQVPAAVLLLDYDGTLAPFSARRDQAYPYPGVVPLLQEIIRTCRTRVVIISGRDAIDIFALLNLEPPPEVWGNHGLQRTKTDGTTEMHRLDERTLDGLSDADRWLGYQRLRPLAELKMGGVAIHWRGMSETRIEDLRSRVLLGWMPIAEHNALDLSEFDGGIEIRARAANKGHAMRTLLSEIGANTPVAYLGDDTTDESAFKAIEGRGISVLVRPTWRRTAAQFWLKPPAELLAFLHLWLQSCLECNANHKRSAAAVNR